MKFFLLVFVLVSFVLNACCGPGPPEIKTATNQLNSDIGTSTTPHIYAANSKKLDLRAKLDKNDDFQNNNRFSQEREGEEKPSLQPVLSPSAPPSPSNDSNIKNKHREHTRKSHGNLPNIHHKLNEKLAKPAIKTGTFSSEIISSDNQK